MDKAWGSLAGVWLVRLLLCTLRLGLQEAETQCSLGPWGLVVGPQARQKPFYCPSMAGVIGTRPLCPLAAFPTQTQVDLLFWEL